MSLTINNLHVSVETKKILHGINLDIPKGEIHVLMGPNGSGKSTLANALAGHPRYTILDGRILMDGEDITAFLPDERAQKGLFLSPQHPPEIDGVTVANFLRVAKESLTGEKQNVFSFFDALTKQARALEIDPSFLNRYLHVGFSGGEKKKLEALQLIVLNPTYAILDETDSGLDVDALKIVARAIQTFARPDKGILLITHYSRLLEYLEPSAVHILIEGKIVKSGKHDLIDAVEREGYITCDN